MVEFVVAIWRVRAAWERGVVFGDDIVGLGSVEGGGNGGLMCAVYARVLGGGRRGSKEEWMRGQGPSKVMRSWHCPIVTL